METQFEFNDCGVCMNPEKPYEYFSKGSIFSDVYVKVAYHPEGGWCYGYCYPNGCCPCSKNIREGLCPTRESAVDKALQRLSKAVIGELGRHERAVSICNGDFDRGYKADYIRYKKLKTIVEGWIAKEHEPIQLSLF